MQKNAVNVVGEMKQANEQEKFVSVHVTAQKYHEEVHFPRLQTWIYRNSASNLSLLILLFDSLGSHLRNFTL
jgi:hypothetical protein